MTQRTLTHGLHVASSLKEFVDGRVLPGTGVSPDVFWSGFAKLVSDLAPQNAALLAERDRLQTALDAWHSANPGPIRKPAACTLTAAIPAPMARSWCCPAAPCCSCAMWVT